MLVEGAFSTLTCSFLGLGLTDVQCEEEEGREGKGREGVER